MHEWEVKQRVHPQVGATSRESEYREYLEWFHRNTRIMVHPPITSLPIDAGDSDDEDPYDTMTRTGSQPQRAPFEHYMVLTKP
jgi:hypothetical protein